MENNDRNRRRTDEENMEDTDAQGMDAETFDREVLEGDDDTM